MSHNRMTRKSLAACRSTRHQRWGQAIVNNFGLKDNQSFSSFVDKLWEAKDEEVKKLVEKMCKDFQLD